VSTIKDVLVLLKKYGFRLNYDKCQFLKRRIEFLGYIAGGNHTKFTAYRGRKKIQAILTNATEVQRFLRLASYFRKFIKDLPLRLSLCTTSQRMTFRLNSMLNVYDTLKREFTSEPVLILDNPAAETELHTDVCASGLGAILLQK